MQTIEALNIGRACGCVHDRDVQRHHSTPTGHEKLIGSKTAELKQLYNGNETKRTPKMRLEWIYAWSSEYEKRFGAKI